MEEKVKKTFEEPKVEKVEFDFKTRIAASVCPNTGMGLYSDSTSCTMDD
jgi:hypothetical protein